VQEEKEVGTGSGSDRVEETEGTRQEAEGSEQNSTQDACAPSSRPIDESTDRGFRGGHYR